MADFDVVVVGSGVAGAICAAGLSASGKKVLVLEAAENGLGVIQREQFKRVWDPAPRKTWNTPYLGMPGIRNYPSPISDDVTEYFDQSPDPAKKSLTTFKATYQRLAGGSTWVWRGNTPRMMPGDFELKSKYFPNVPADQLPDKASIVDWPVKYNDMKAWYLKAEQELGVAGNADEWESITPRDGAKFPMPAQPKSYSDQVLIKRLRAKGLKSVQLDGESVPIDILTMAQARNTEPYDGRPACEGNHNCIPLCPTNAKYDATIHLKRAVRSGAELRTGCVVTQLKAGAGGKIESVTYKDWKSDNPMADRTVTADLVILAANPIETPKFSFCQISISNPILSSAST